MRVAFIVPSLRVASGWRRASLGIIRALSEFAGVEPFVVVSRREREGGQGSALEGIGGLTLPEIQFMSFRQVRSLGRMLRTWVRLKRVGLPRLDLVHSLEGYPTALVGHWLSRRADVPHVITSIGSYSVQWRNLLPDRWVYEAVLQDSQGIFPISNGTASSMRLHFPLALAGKDLRVVLLGSDRAEKVPRQIAEDSGSGERNILLSVGSIKPRKGYHVSLEAFTMVKERIPSAEYWIVGTVAPGYRRYFDSLQEKVEKSGLDGVKFWGQVSETELDQLYRGADVFVLTPQTEGLHFEGFGLVYLEAGAYGLPVVGSDSGGVSDAVRRGETGFLVEPLDVKEIAEAIIRLLSDRELKRKMGLANRAWSEVLTWQRFAGEQREMYEKVLAKWL